MTDLDGRARQLIDAARREPGLDEETRAQGRARLRTSLAGAGLAAAAAAGTRTAAAASGWSLGAKATAGVSVVLAGGALYALGAPAHGGPESERAVSAPVVQESTPVASAAAVTLEASPATPSSPAGPAPSQVSVASSPHRQTHSVPVAPHAPPGPGPRPDVAASLAADVKLLRDVRAALAAGQPDAALRLLQIRRADPDPGGLAPEREAARLVTLCRLGRVEEARRGARTFLRSHPGSPLAARIREECP